jgi:branched-chain amino acid transport system ATP-binding protein
MTVEENLLMGAYTLDASRKRERLDQVYALFDRVAQKRRSVAGLLSGGEQQMVAIGRALIGSPRLLMLDEPSLGLAPMIIDDIFKAVTRLNRESGLSILFVEQNAKLALEVAEYAYIMENGRIVLDGSAQSLAQNPDIQEFYLGQGADGQRKSLRDLKHYKRRKRWLS